MINTYFFTQNNFLYFVYLILLLLLFLCCITFLFLSLSCNITVSYYCVISQTRNQRTHPFAWEFFFLLWLNIYFSTKFIAGCRRPSVQLSLSNSLCKFQFKISISLPPYEREVWHLIRKAMNEFNCERGFFNLDISEMVSVCNTTIKNIIPLEAIICDDRDPSSINKRIKKLIDEQNGLVKTMITKFLKH